MLWLYLKNMGWDIKAMDTSGVARPFDPYTRAIIEESAAAAAGIESTDEVSEDQEAPSQEAAAQAVPVVGDPEETQVIECVKVESDSPLLLFNSKHSCHRYRTNSRFAA
jgi:hypothetical protein